jgi:transposase-like protein
MKNMEITCPHCGNNEHIKKNGHYKEQQVYRCSKCSKTFRLSNEDKRIKHEILLKKLAVSFYLVGTSIRGIQLALETCFQRKFSFNIINSWLVNSNNILEHEKKRRKTDMEDDPVEKYKIKHIRILEMDELFTFIKKNPKIQKGKNIMINEYGLLWIGAEMNLLHLR